MNIGSKLERAVEHLDDFAQELRYLACKEQPLEPAALWKMAEYVQAVSDDVNVAYFDVLLDEAEEEQIEKDTRAFVAARAAERAEAPA